MWQIQAFDQEHNKNNKALVIKLGDSDAMLDAVQDAISEMYVGQKAQAMIPPQLGFCDKGLCGQEMG
jgi:FKBP-type peptidyl-prolyl cis-trans isomerase